jgi:S-DNA-T family DNA segregation ATPase FtsK/SpoIIIE
MARIGVHTIDVYNNRMRQKASRERYMGRAAQPADAQTPFPRVLATVANLEAVLTHAPRDAMAALLHCLDHGPDAGVHFVLLATAPHVESLRSEIIDRITTRLIFRQPTAAASQLLLGQRGAEWLERPNDALLVTPSSAPLCVHVAEATVAEVGRVVASLSAPIAVQAQSSTELAATSPATTSEESKSTSHQPIDDELYDRAINVVLRTRQPYSGQLARTLGVTRAEAVALIDLMVDDGIVSAADDVGNQRVLIERRPPSAMR